MIELDVTKFAADDDEETWAARTQKDMELFNQWRDNGKKSEHLKPLLHVFRPMIRKESNKYATFTRDVETPPAAIHAEYDKWFLHALDTYEPGKGPLSPWIRNNLRKAQRWTMNHRNLARIAEKRAYHDVGAYNNARSVLDDQLGRPPSTPEIAEHLGWPDKKVSLLQSEIHRTNISSGFAEDPTMIMPSRHAEVLDNIYYQLNDQEKNVYDFMLGRNGKPQLNATQIAQQLRISQSTVTRIKQTIAGKMKGYI
jgi:hypothetical protein